MPKVVELATGKVFELSAEAALQHVNHKSGGYAMAEGERINVNTVSGVQSVGASGAEGFQAETIAQTSKREQAEYMEREHGGLGGEVRTFVEQAVDTAGLGIPGTVVRALDPKAHEDIRARARTNPGSATTGQVVGAVAPALASGGSSVVARGLAANPIGKLASAGTKLAGRGHKVKALVGEGIIEGAGMGLQDAMLQDKVTLERALSSMKTGALTGGAAGGVVGVMGKAVDKGLRKASKLLNTPSKKASSVTPRTQDPAQGIIEAMETHRNATGDTLGLLHGGDKLVVTRARNSMRSKLSHADKLKANPASFRDQLQKEAQVFEGKLADTGALLQQGAKHDVKTLARLNKAQSEVLPIKGPVSGLDVLKKPDTTKLVVTGKLANAYGDWANKAISKAAAKEGVAVSQKQVTAFKLALESGEMATRRAKVIEQLPEMLANNKRIQQQATDLIEFNKAAKKAEAIAAKGPQAGMAENAAIGAAFSVGTAASAAVLPDELKFLSPMLGSAAANKMSRLTLGRMSNAAGETASRMEKALEAFTAVATKASTKLARHAAVPLATRALTSGSLGPAVDPGAPIKGDDDVATAYRARAKEIYAQVMATPQGLQMTPQARARVYDSLAPVRAVNAQIADTAESQVARRVAYLAEKLPKRPDSNAIRTGPDTWRPSDMQIRDFARSLAAVEDPVSVFERVANGTITPADAEAVKAVYPEQFYDFQSRVLADIKQLRAKLSYQKRLALSIFTGLPVDPSLAPEVLAVLQASYAEEDGAGMESPKASADFGSMRKSTEEPTPGQKRAK